MTRGKNIMQGYWNNPEATAETFDGDWLLTGDIGDFDEQGRLFITGRKKEILVSSSGKNINPVSLEQHLEESTGLIREVGVFLKDDVIQAVIRPDLAPRRRFEVERRTRLVGSLDLLGCRRWTGIALRLGQHLATQRGERESQREAGRDHRAHGRHGAPAE